MTNSDEQIALYLKSFEACKFDLDGIEAWNARSLLSLLKYSRWEKFRPVIERAYVACKNAGHETQSHFLVGDGSTGWHPNDEVFHLEVKNSKGGRPKEDVIVTRFGAYLITINSDPTKDVVAFAQHYFATSTRKLEVLQKRITEGERIDARKQLADSEKRLSSVLNERNVDGRGFARIRDAGDRALFGVSTAEMKDRLGLPRKGKPLADKLPTVTTKAKELAAAMTAHQTVDQNLYGVTPIQKEHTENNSTIRDALTSRGIFPEDLPAEEDIKKVERRHKAEVRKMTKPQIAKKDSKKKKAS